MPDYELEWCEYCGEISDKFQVDNFIHANKRDRVYVEYRGRDEHGSWRGERVFHMFCYIAKKHPIILSNFYFTYCDYWNENSKIYEENRKLHEEINKLQRVLDELEELDNINIESHQLT